MEVSDIRPRVGFVRMALQTVDKRHLTVCQRAVFAVHRNIYLALADAIQLHITVKMHVKAFAQISFSDKPFCSVARLFILQIAALSVLPIRSIMNRHPRLVKARVILKENHAPITSRILSPARLPMASCAR